MLILLRHSLHQIAFPFRQYVSLSSGLSPVHSAFLSVLAPYFQLLSSLVCIFKTPGTSCVISH